ncbi:MAG: ABC transporter ATP-binding protein, partial [Acidimicrobiales bacterium]
VLRLRDVEPAGVVPMTIDQARPTPSADLSVPPPSGPDPDPALTVAAVTVGYGETTIVSDVSFDLAPGEWLAVIGPNGAGKSTLLKAIVGVLAFDGRIELQPGAEGGPGGRAGRRRRLGTAGNGSARRIAYVPQRPILPLGMTTAEYVLLGRTAHLGWFQTESKRDRRRVCEVLDQLDLAPMAGRPIAELSGGEGQRATLARALVQEASVLVLDEPTSALDLAHQIAVLELIDRVRSEHDLAVITAVHDLTIASRFADRLLLVAEGGSVAIGSAAEVLTEGVLSRYYKTPVTVMDGPDGGVVVVPLRSPSRAETTDREARRPL